MGEPLGYGKPDPRLAPVTMALLPVNLWAGCGVAGVLFWGMAVLIVEPRDHRAVTTASMLPFWATVKGPLPGRTFPLIR